MIRSFLNNLDRRMFSFLCFVTFLGSLTTSTLTFLSTILADAGYSQRETGAILAAPLVPVLLALLSAGAVLRKISCIELMIVGQGFVVAGFIGLEYGFRSFFIAAIFRGLIGLGVGFYFSASMIYVRSLLVGPKTIYLFGIFASMMPLPNAIGPSIAEWYFRHNGIEHFFLCMAIPASLAFSCLVLALKKESIGIRPAFVAPLSYLKILRTREFCILGLGIFSIGLMWGFVIAYMSLYLSQSHVSVGLFFVPMSLILFGSRFGFLSRISHLPKNLLTSISFSLMALAFALILALQTSTSSVIAGFFFGLGYSLGFPVLGVWVSDAFDVENRPIAMSLFNVFFHGGIFMVPLMVGLLENHFGLNYSLVLLIAIAMGMGLYFYWSVTSSKNSGMELI